MEITSKTTLGGILYKYKAHHILLWVVYFLFWTSFYRKSYSSLPFLIETVGIYFIFNAGQFYLTAYYLIPKYFYKGRYGVFLVSFLSSLVLASLGLSIALYFMFRDVNEVSSNVSGIFQIAMLSIGSTVGALSSAKLVIEKVRTDRVAKQLEKDKLETELQYLKSQVNPHFLFNAINSVYILIRKDPELAADTLIKLSDLLRFQLYDCTDEKIPIEKEMEYLQNYISLEQTRKGEKVKVLFTTNGYFSGFQIAPFLLIPFLENAFKFVSMKTDFLNEIRIELTRDNERIDIAFYNTCEARPKSDVGGIGLKNVKRRLELLYPVITVCR